MKKLVVLSILSLALVSCGEKKVDITPKEEKIKIVQGKLDGDYELREKYYSIQQELQKLADEGNKSAEEELERWEKIYDEESVKNMFKMNEENKKSVEEMRRTGKIW